MNKTELHAELVRIDARIRFLNAAFRGIDKDPTTLHELALLLKSREFVLTQLKS